MEDNEKKNIDQENLKSLLRGKGEIKFNFKWTLLFIVFFAICWGIGSLQGTFWALNLNTFWTILFFLLAFSAFLYSITIKQSLKLTILFFLASTALLVDIFQKTYCLIKGF